jgi:hypothetical protein
VTLDGLSLLHPAGPGMERPAHRAGPVTRLRPPPGTSPRSIPRGSPTSWSTSTIRPGR